MDDGAKCGLHSARCQQSVLDKGVKTEATLYSDCPEATEALGAALGRSAIDGDVLLLTGGLGAGKTSLTKGIARGAGHTGTVRSPTFAVMHEYSGEPSVYHLDLYRGDASLLEDTGILDLLGHTGLCVIEWADRASEALAAENLEPLNVAIEADSESFRLLRAHADSKAGERLLARWLREAGQA